METLDLRPSAAALGEIRRRSLTVVTGAKAAESSKNLSALRPGAAPINNMKIRSLFGALLCSGAVLGSLPVFAQDSSAPLGGSEPADVIIYNAKVLTVNSNFSTAQAVVIRDGRIVAVGKDKLLETYRGPKTRLLDAQGK